MLQACSILIRGANEFMLDEASRSVPQMKEFMDYVMSHVVEIQTSKHIKTHTRDNAY